MRKIALVALTLTMIVGIASAQRPTPSPMEDSNKKMAQERQQTQAANRPTKAEPMASSLAQLLSEGWRITSGGIGPMGTQLVITAHDRWALCDIKMTDGLGDLIEQPISRCMALN